MSCSRQVLTETTIGEVGSSEKVEPDMTVGWVSPWVGLGWVGNTHVDVVRSCNVCVIRFLVVCVVLVH